MQKAILTAVVTGATKELTTEGGSASGLEWEQAPTTVPRALKTEGSMALKMEATLDAQWGKSAKTWDIPREVRMDFAMAEATAVRKESV